MRELLIDFGIPAMLIVGSFLLLGLGIDSEVKAVLAMAAAWAFHGAVARRSKGGNNA